MALYSLKQQDFELTKQMQEEIEQIKSKYNLLKMPINLLIAQAANGQPVSKEYYTPDASYGLTIP